MGSALGNMTPGRICVKMAAGERHCAETRSYELVGRTVGLFFKHRRGFRAERGHQPSRVKLRRPARITWARPAAAGVLCEIRTQSGTWKEGSGPGANLVSERHLATKKKLVPKPA